MRHALITAGTKGLGRQITEYFLNHGYRVTATYRSDEQKAKQLLEKHADKPLHIVQLDVQDAEQIRKVVSQVYHHTNRIDCLISNAGPFIFERKKLMDYSSEEWNSMVRGNLDASFHLAQSCIPYMRAQEFGRIIFLGFQGVDHSSGWIYRSAFASAKVGVASLMKTIALEEAEHKITANMVAPGKIIDSMKEKTILESRENHEHETPIGREGTGEDIARTVGFLCHDDSDMITGTVVDVNGGMDVIHRYL
ncbi:SDR family oxidoreductase [Piscibacillus halophilus]|uniref:3-oxoacyl-[acyl-carrier protein] reductase n=1 Tax=Piscibacillus halophilus TaxID=571933 RepID=A0A1H9MGE5_9BACI|nr:SDR family oxidoreductase [Piscibacillus halophilus]SER22537.1 3-oxoacyl-[acyl-carrier protein] reductase [Piscibacillus halophilus]